MTPDDLRKMDRRGYIRWLLRLAEAIETNATESRTPEGWLAWSALRGLAPERRERLVRMLGVFETRRAGLALPVRPRRRRQVTS